MNREFFTRKIATVGIYAKSNTTGTSIHLICPQELSRRCLIWQRQMYNLLWENGELCNQDGFYMHQVPLST